MSDWRNFILGNGPQHERPCSTQTALALKAVERAELEAAIEAFLAKGGEIEVRPTTASQTGKMEAMRRGDYELITVGEIAKRWKVTNLTVISALHKWPLMLYIMRGPTRAYCLDDIRRVEAQPGYKLVKGAGVV